MRRKSIMTINRKVEQDKEEHAQHTSGFSSSQTSSFDLYHNGSRNSNRSDAVEDIDGNSPAIAMSGNMFSLPHQFKR